MKKLGILVILAFVACSDSPATPEKVEAKRINWVYTDGTFSIIEADGHVYLSRFEGGITHMESCKCRMK